MEIIRSFKGLMLRFDTHRLVLFLSLLWKRSVFKADEKRLFFLMALFFLPLHHHAYAQSAFANLRNPPPATTSSDGEEVIKVKPHKRANSLASALGGGGVKIRPYASSSSLLNQRATVGFQPFRNESAQTAMRDETRVFGSMPLPIGGGEFAPYLGPGSTYQPEAATWLPKSFPAFMDQETVTGDWGGWRTKLKNRGINLGGRWLMEWNGNPGGGRKHAGRFADEEAIYADFDFQKLFGVHLGTLHFLMTMRQGSTALTQDIPVLDSVQEIAGGGTGTPGYAFTRLTRLSWEMLWNKYVRTEIGEMNTESDFEQSSSYWGANLYCQFVNNGICGMPQSIAINSGYTWYPGSSPGAYVKFYPTGDDQWLISGGIYADKSNFGARDNYWNLGLDNAVGAFVPVQLGWHRGSASDYTGPLQSNIKIGAYWDSRWTQTVDSPSKLSMFQGFAYSPTLVEQFSSPQTARSAHGAWIQGDTMLERDGKDPRRGTTIFGTFTWGDPRTSPAPYFVTLGIVRKGTFRNRPNDTISLGGKMLWVNDQVAQWVKDLPAGACAKTGGCWTPGMESALELNYGWRPANWLLIRPNLQFVFGPGGINRYSTATVVGLETGIIF